MVMVIASLCLGAYSQEKEKDTKTSEKTEKKDACKSKEHKCTDACKDGNHVYAHGEKGHVCTDACKKKM